MTAVNVVCQKRHNRIQIMTDAASYNQQGIIHCFGTKLFAVSHWPGIVTGRGTSITVPLIGQLLSWEFATFDDAVDGLEAKLPGMIDSVKTQGSVELILAGFSQRAGEPQAFVINSSDDLPIGLTADQLADGVALGIMQAPPPAYRIERLPDSVMAPALDIDLAVTARWQGIDENDPPHKVLSALRHTIEIQRQQTADGVHLIGGFVEHAVVTPDGVSIQMIDRWPEDRVGQLVKPAPADWSVWTPERGSTSAQEDWNMPGSSLIGE